MNIEQVKNALLYGRPGEEWSCPLKADITVDDIDWIANTPKPNQTEIDTMLAAYQLYISSGGDKDDKATGDINTPQNKAIVDAFLEFENRIRVLENNQTQATRNQIVQWLRSKYRSYL